MAQLRKFWLRFAMSPGEVSRYPSWAGLGLGCGVTAYSLDDARGVLREALFRGDPLPEIEEAIEDVDVGDLDQGRVVPNMGLAHERGVWFPRL
jgi:hypothetical protein